ncbi:DEAD/DEAH box helicase domain protein [Methanohalobium evestigatum Z-7303]|uniref:DEAD/DEAH box helicase domain protein n=1 Tax=Methanohalobium evestigatum (strain ATCC BAA-1072 / DSM 3721 / NBRC 107634 / OCM 161 / Z-7303) TaxID=644295 RepID=D7E7K8_METEZ|nr:DEAD/DEAH box helicase [Methanohalobium evestigatum]ADI74081.1 DEAD/DEAH box helicase domain protein [Methanohalobium evestigatum Z-7303]
MSIDPIEATKQITDKYCSYLSTNFYLNDTELQEKFQNKLEPEIFVKGPILEATPPFEKGNTLKDLINEGLLSKKFELLESEDLPLDRPLYKHQEKAIRNIINKNKNAVVATGTGSGKTEIFMITILNYLFKQQENSELGPGVRALLLYPMNALANDQLKRMRTLLKNCPEITFGRYTGETEENYRSARDKYKQMYHEEPLDNEFISRDKMKETPPHILLTNYAMLEYLMLRPSDHIFFDGSYADDWKFIVLDEAHTYDGAKGIEISMLIRRLKDRVVGNIPGEIKCIATSATLGNSDSDFKDVADFSNKLFGEHFDENDVIGPERKIENFDGSWGKPSYLLYQSWQDIINQNDTDKITALIESGVNHNVPVDVLEESRNRCEGDYQKFLYHVLKGDDNLISLRNLLEEEPHSTDNIANKIFPDVSNQKNVLVSLVDLSVKAKHHRDDQSLIPARYHLFVKAIEGAYLSILPEKEIYLERREYIDDGDKKYPVFEIANCINCGSIYLVGETETGINNKKIFKQPGQKYHDDPKNLEYYLLINSNVELLPDNEDEEIILNNDQKNNKHLICAACGSIDKSNVINDICDCGKNNYIEVVKVNSKNGNVHKCPACTKTRTKGTVVRRFLQSKDAIASVLATSLYQQIPEKKLSNPGTGEHTNIDEWDPINNSVNNSNSDTSRQLLVFSDNRQDAAFFAPYLNRTYSKILRRRLILKTLDENSDKLVDNDWWIGDLVNPLKKQLKQFNLYPHLSPQEQENEIWKWLLYELLGIDSDMGLQGMGFIGFTLVKPDKWVPPPPLKKEPWNLSDDEIWILYQILLDSFRKYGAIHFPDVVDPKDEFFSPKNNESYFREFGSSKTKNIKSWVPNSDSHLNTRLDFLMRLSKKLGVNKDKKELIDLLKNIWKTLALNKADRSSYPWYDYFKPKELKGEGISYQLEHKFWKINYTKAHDTQWYYCDKCQKLTLFNLKGVCPTYRCEGTLRKCDPEELYKDNHYWNLYSNLDPMKLIAEEHTAQLTNEVAADLQTKFINGEVNVLSCSTTFELGVDVGELESVFMRNVPPSAANYVQRAGRSGRRTDSTAFVLTFCKRSSHDITHFNNPMKLVSGEIKPPFFEIENEKIIKRHMYSIALAKFWKIHNDKFKNVDTFFFDNKGPEYLKDYLDSKPKDIQDSLYRIVPETLHDAVGVDDWSWINGLLDDNKGVLTKAKHEVESDVNSLTQVWDERYKEGKRSDYLLRTINTIKKKPLINYLSSHNVLPKYGFPVDVVNLEIFHHSDEANNLELNRDLKIALSEYAPSNKIVAGGKLWTSRYLKKVPHRELPKYKYVICSNCHRYQRVLANSNESLDHCKSCDAPLTGNERTFVIPEFGFIVSRSKPEKIGEKEPKKSFTTRNYYSGESNKNNELVLPLKSAIQLRAISASHAWMSVINHAGWQSFKICNRCGYTVLGNDKVDTHEDPWGKTCNGRFIKSDLGHEYMTDILQINLEGYSNDNDEFWFSLLYAILEGASSTLGIDRSEIDGCLYSYKGDPTSPAILLFDDVPGGAGHVKRITQDKETISNILESTYTKMSNCNCGGEDGNSSCYACLRNYKNQFCHDMLYRSEVMRFLEKYFFD